MGNRVYNKQEITLANGAQETINTYGGTRHDIFVNGSVDLEVKVGSGTVALGTLTNAAKNLYVSEPFVLQDKGSGSSVIIISTDV